MRLGLALCVHHLDLQGVYCSTQSSLISMASASFLVKVVLQLSGKVTCLPLQGWARGTLVSITLMTEGAIAPPFTHSQSQQHSGMPPGGFLLLAYFLRPS